VVFDQSAWVAAAVSLGEQGLGSCGYFRVFLCTFWATRACKSGWWLNSFLGNRNTLAVKYAESMRISSFCPLGTLWCHFESPFFKLYHLLCQDRSNWVAAIAFQLWPSAFAPSFLAGRSELPGGGIPRGQSVRLRDVEVMPPRLRTLPAGLSWDGGLLSTLSSFPFPGLSLTISTPAPRVPSFQSSGQLQRFSPTATTAPNLTFGHLVRINCQNGKKSTNISSEKPRDSVLKGTLLNTTSSGLQGCFAWTVA